MSDSPEVNAVVDGAAPEDGADLVDAAIEVSVPDPQEKEEIQAAEAKAGEVQMLPISLIEKSEVALRDVDRQNESYILLCDSIRKRGVLNSILVRQVAAPGGAVKYGLIDGLQRFTASHDVGKTHIPARIVDMDDAELLEAQVITNLTRVTTKPAEVSKHFLRILSRNPYMTIDELADKICQSRTYVEQRLSLTKLLPDIQKLVNDGSINLTNAYALAKVPEEEQAEHVEAAMTESPKQFVPRMKERIKEIKDAKRQGKDAKPAEFKPTQFMQKVGDVKAELEALETGSEESKVMALLEAHNINDPKEAAKMTVAWMLHFDPESQAEQKQKHEAKVEKRKADAERRKKEREERKEEEARRKAEDVSQGL